MYKLVTAEGKSPIAPAQGNPAIRYGFGETIEIADANADATEECGRGIHLATLDWCIRYWRPGYRILVAEFDVADIAVVPVGTDGKIRVRRATIVGEKSLKELGLEQGRQPE